MGLGMGLVMSPMSTAAMNAVDRTKAGAASGVLSMSRMVGGTFGVAVMGALVTTIGPLEDRLRPPPRSRRDARRARQLARRRRRRSAHHASAQIVTTVREAFVSALGTGLTIGGAVTLAGALVAWVLIENKPSRLRPSRPPAPGSCPTEESARELSAA